jgi:hypothetical protein
MCSTDANAWSFQPIRTVSAPRLRLHTARPNIQAAPDAGHTGRSEIQRAGRHTGRPNIQTAPRVLHKPAEHPDGAGARAISLDGIITTMVGQAEGVSDLLFVVGGCRRSKCMGNCEAWRSKALCRR